MRKTARSAADKQPFAASLAAPIYSLDLSVFRFLDTLFSIVPMLQGKILAAILSSLVLRFLDPRRTL